MDQRRIAILGIIGAAFAFMAVTIYYASLDYPMVGHDFDIYVSHSLDALLHYLINGFSIQWYTPTFGSGLPAYPNPLHTQFTLYQALIFFTNPWVAIWVSFVIYTSIGIATAYYFFEKILKLHPYASGLGAIIFGINGFIFSHAIVGQPGFQFFSLLPLITITIFHPDWSSLQKGALLSLVLWLNIQGAGFYTIVIYFLALLCALPVIIWNLPQPPRLWHLFNTGIWTAILTIGSSGSKIFAVMAYLNHFPRIVSDHYKTTMLDGLQSILWQLFGTSTYLTIARLFRQAKLADFISRAHSTSGVGRGFSLWEFDNNMSPAVLIIFLLAVIFWVSNKHAGRPERKNFLKWSVLAAWTLFAFWLTTEFRLAEGLFYPTIRTLPILRSLHVNFRFASAYIFPLAVFSALAFDRFQGKIQPRLQTVIFAGLALISVLPLANYFVIPTKMYNFTYNVGNSQTLYSRIRSGERFQVEQNADGVDGVTATLRHASDLYPYEAIFGYFLEDFNPQTKVGSIWIEENGYFNMTNPSGMVYPTENNIAPFERIKTSDKNNLELFANRHQPDWERPLAQKILDGLMWVSLMAVIAICFTLIPWSKPRKPA